MSERDDEQYEILKKSYIPPTSEQLPRDPATASSGPPPPPPAKDD
jgi:hypothetical protein